jgi:hypothetical protein
LSEAAAGAGDGRPPADPPARSRAPASAPGSDPLARAVFALLVVACLAAFLITQRLKHTPTAVHNFKLGTAFSPYPGGNAPLEAIAIELANAEDVTVTIVDSAGDTVATLVTDYPAPRYRTFSLRWNGRRGTAHGYGYIVTPDGRSIPVPKTEGKLAPPGEYRVGLSLRHRAQQLLLPRSFALVKP